MEKARPKLPFDPRLVDTIRCTLSVAETGKPDWDPGKVYIYADDNRFNPPRKQITLSVGFTEGGGNLKKVLAAYIKEDGQWADAFEPFMKDLGSKNHDSLANNQIFTGLLRKAGKDEVMGAVQQACFEKLYIAPAFKWADEGGFKKALSYLVIADSFLHSGSMLGFLLRKFPEKKPSAGGREKVWIEDYCRARLDWLANHSNRILRNTTYRPECFLAEIDRDNWNLQVPIVMNGVAVQVA